MYECALCGKRLGENPLTYWCSRCYADWREAILNHEEWTVYLTNLESKRRYDEKRDKVLMYLGNDDLYQEAGKYKVLHKIEDGETL